MPSKKQRRRREKERRHEYEYVYVDGEGQEVGVDPDEAGIAKPERKAARSGGNGRASTAVRGRTGRNIEPPSWRRALKRSAIFAPFMFLTIALLNRGSALSASVLVTLWMLTIFVPFTYLIDRTMYRRFGSQRAERPAGRRGAAKG
jgi:hypothetical protein